MLLLSRVSSVFSKLWMPVGISYYFSGEGEIAEPMWGRKAFGMLRFQECHAEMCNTL